uniref:Reverse transcriptase RNase H-like domain-containing protein n=1 Tax=Tanacetum cinerariifolium TaxID=118510 RepID=A0A6L2KM85_TANCI|nr:hypothetical protein [Tanacetum cinerariifolium]
MMSTFLQMQMQQPSGLWSLPSNTVANPRGDLKDITTRSGVANDGPTIPPTPLPNEVERETETTKDKLDECLALADLGTRINLMPYSVWKKLSLLELTSTRMTFELTDRSTVKPIGVAEDVFIKVEKFYFLADFVVVDYNVNPQVPLILGRPFLRMARALIDVYGKEMTHRVNDEAITFKVRHTSRYSRNYYDETVHQVNVIDVACKEYAQEYDTEGDILYLEKLLNDDPSPNLPSMKNEDLKQVDAIMTKPLIEEPPELELMDLLSHLEYAIFKAANKLPVIISKELKDEEKVAFLKVLNSHKRAIVWKISDIKGIDPRFYTHKILMEDDFKPAVQHQRRVNLKIHEPIHYASKTMTDAQAHYTTTEKELLAVVYAFEKFRPYLVLSKIIVYMDHSALKYLLAKQDAKPRLLRWSLLLQEFDVIIRDKKRAKNLTTDHLSRLENPHEGDLEKKEINETFPLETLGMVASRSDSGTPWFSDIANTMREICSERDVVPTKEEVL